MAKKCVYSEGEIIMTSSEITYHRTGGKWQNEMQIQSTEVYKKASFMTENTYFNINIYVCIYMTLNNFFWKNNLPGAHGGSVG